ncbi:uncharacterized protein METZ01_LOCUS420992, partial [marine metagenome]
RRRRTFRPGVPRRRRPRPGGDHLGRSRRTDLPL